MNDKSPSELPNEFFAVSEQRRHHVTSQMHQVKLSLRKITTRHGNDTHSALTKEPQFDTRPSGPILVSFFMQEKEQNKAALQRSAEAGP